MLLDSLFPIEARYLEHEVFMRRVKAQILNEQVTLSRKIVVNVGENIVHLDLWEISSSLTK